MKQEADKLKNAKSAGEVALMFMGINKLSYELLMENPMTGYMNDIILSRVLGMDDIYEGEAWKDGCQCWVCDKWDKITIEYHDHDHKLMKSKISRLGELHELLKEIVDLSNDRRLS